MIPSPTIKDSSSEMFCMQIFLILFAYFVMVAEDIPRPLVISETGVLSKILTVKITIRDVMNAGSNSYGKNGIFEYGKIMEFLNMENNGIFE